MALPLLAWHGQRVCVAEPPAHSAWRLPSLERGRQLAAEMDQLMRV